MENNIQAFFIYANNCEHCDQTLRDLNSAMIKTRCSLNINKFQYDSNIAINIAIKNNVNDLPAIVFSNDGGMLQGEKITEEQIINCLKKAMENG